MKGLLNKHILLFGVCGLAVLLIGFKFNQIPSHLAFDELQFAELSLSLSEKPYHVYTSEATGHATLYYYILTASLSLFGVSSFALRLPAAVFGILAIAVFYAISARIWEDKRMVFLAPLVLISMRWYYTFARYSFEATFLLLLELISIWSILMFSKTKSTFMLFVSAFSAGLAFHSYIAGRIFVVVPLGLLTLLAFKKKIEWKSVWTYICIAAIVMLPLITYFIHNPDIRIAQTSILADASLSTGEKISAVGSNIFVNAKMFVTDGDMNGRHNFPGKAAVSPIVLLLSLFGVAVSIKRRNMYDVLFLIYAVVALLPTMFTHTYENPHMLRTFTLLPSIAYFSTVSVYVIMDRWKKYAQYIVVGAYLFVLLSLVYDARTYFMFQSRVMRNSFEVTCPLDQALTYEADEIGDIPPECRTTENLY